jgi:hypothetical protein
VGRISRRDFIHAGCATGAVSLVPNRAKAWTPGAALAATGKKAQVNLNIFGSQFDFPFVNMVRTFSAFSSRGAGAPTQDAFPFLNADGYPTGLPSGTGHWECFGSIYYPGGYATFTGSVSGNVLTVSGPLTGDPLAIGRTIRGKGITAGTRIVSGGGTTWQLNHSMSATGSIAITATIPWVIDWTGKADVHLGVGGNGLVTVTTVSISANRIEYHLQPYPGAVVNGSLSGNTLAVASFVSGSSIPTRGALGALVTGPGMPPYTCLQDRGNGGGIGNYTIIEPAGGSPRTVSYSASGQYTIGACVFGTTINSGVSIFAITTTPSNIRVYRQDQESLLATQLCAPHFISYYSQYGRIRFLNWMQTNGNMQAQWIQRPGTTNFSWTQNNVIPALYGGVATKVAKNEYSSAGAISYTDASGVTQSNPSSWTDGMMLQTSITKLPFAWDGTGTISGNTLTVVSSNSGALAIGLQVLPYGDNNPFTAATITANLGGGQWTINGRTQTIASATVMYGTVAVTGFTNANPAKVTAINHGYSTGDVIFFPLVQTMGGSIASNLNFGISSGLLAKTNYTITVIDPNNFTLNGVDSTTWGTYTGGGTVTYQLRFKSGLLPYKTAIAQYMQSLTPDTLGRLMGTGFAVNQSLITLVYSASLDVLILQPPDAIGRGVPIETACQVAKECGVDAWISVPMQATDNFVTQMATTIKSNLPSQKWCFELANEVWNTAPGFSQSNYAQFMPFAQFPGVFTNSSQGMYEWYGYRFYQMAKLINAVYSGPDHAKCVRIFGFKTDDAVAAPTFNDFRLKSPHTGLPAFPITLADELCCATYIGGDFNLQTDAAKAIGNYQQGVLTSNAALVTSALNDADAAFFTYYSYITPYWTYYKNLAATFSVKLSAYEGGFSVVPNIWWGGDNKPTSPSSYLGIAFNSLDQLNLWTAYQASSQYGASYTQFLNLWKSLTGICSSQYQSTGLEPTPGSMWSMRNNIFGPTNPGESSFNAYSAS